MLRLIPVAALAACAVGCHEDAALFVDVRTDLVPGVEFDEAVVVLPTDGEASTDAVAGQDWIAGERVFESENLDSGESFRFVAQLRRGGRTVLSRPVRVALEARLAVTVALTRDCRGACYEDGEQQACVNGRCVQDTCTDEALAGCGVPSCAGPSDCAPPSGCAVPYCVAGACLFDEDPSRCPADAVCVPDLGCVTHHRGDVPTVEWVYTAPDPSGIARAVGVDDAGDVYVAGELDGSTDFGGGPIDPDGRDPFVLALDAAGVYRWSQVLVSPASTDPDASEADAAHAIDVRTVSDTVAVGGWLVGPSSFPGDDVADATPDAFVATFGLDGTPRRLQRIGGDAGEARALSVLLGPTGGIFVGGDFREALTAGGASFVSVEGTRDAWLASLGADGALDWIVAAGDNEDDHLRDMVFDMGGRIASTGAFEGGGDFGPGPLSGGSDAQTYVATWNPANGDAIESWNSGLDISSTGNGIAVDSAGNFYVCGFYRDDHVFGGRQLINRGVTDGYLFSLSPTFDVRWVVDFGSLPSDGATAVVVDGNDNVWVTGEFENIADFGGGPVFAGGQDCEMFVASYDSDGNHRFTYTVGAGGDDLGTALAVSGDGAVTVVGRVSSGADLGAGPVEESGLFVIRFRE